MLCLRGCWASRPCPRTYPRRGRDETRAPSLRRVYPSRPRRYYEPLGLPPGTAPLRLRLIGAAFARRGRRGGSLLFRARLSLRAVLHTPGASCAPPTLARAVCCLRRDMTGSAAPPFGSYVTGLQGSRDVRPATSPPSRVPYGTRRAFDAPLVRWSLPPRLEPATRRLGWLVAAGLPPASPAQHRGPSA